MGKIRKGLSTLLLAVIMVGVIASVTIFAEGSIGVIDDSLVEEFPDDQPDKTIVELKGNATTAYQALIRTFPLTDEGEYIYPDDFAGAWRDGMNLCVALTSDDEKTVEKYRSILKGYDGVTFEKVKYSMNELLDLQEAAYDFLKEDYEIVSYFTDVESNKAVLEVIPSDVDKAKQSLYSALNSIASLTLGSKKLDMESFDIISGQRMEFDSSLYGGAQIVSKSDSSRSVGVCGTLKTSSGNYQGFVTAGHNLFTTGDSRYQYLAKDHPKGPLLGEVSTILWKDGAVGDWVTVKVTNTDVTLTNKVYGSSTSTVRSITGVLDNGSYKFVGEHTGTVSGNLYFTPYSSFKKYFTVKTSSFIKRTGPLNVKTFEGPAFSMWCAYGNRNIFSSM